MKRIILIVAIALLPVLSACFICRRPPYPPDQAPILVPEVSKFGTLTNLKDDKGRRLFKKPIQEGFYVSYRVGYGEGGKRQYFYAIGDRVSNPKASYSGFQEKISGAGITTPDGGNGTSGCVFDKSKGTLKATKAIVNISEGDTTMYLSEVKNSIDTNLLPLHTKVGTTTDVGPLQTGNDRAIRSSGTGIVNLITQNCWPCKSLPDCVLETALPDPTRATVVCINCEEGAEGVIHVVCLADLEQKRAEYKKEGCEHQITYIGIDARPDKTSYEECPLPPATDKGLPETNKRGELILPARAAVVIRTEYKVNLFGK